MSASGKSLLKKWVSRFSYLVFLLVLLFSVGEIAVRLMGFQPWDQAAQSFEVKPTGSFFREDSLLGYAGKPGKFELTLDEQLHFKVSHGPNGYRICEQPSTSDSLPRPEIWIFGCSFTHGFGVNDQDAWPYLLQQQLPKYKIRNFAMDGYGTYHSLLQLRQIRQTLPPPAWTMLAYGAFHNQRNVNSRSWKKALSGREVVDGIQYPYLRYEENGDLSSQLAAPEYKPWPGMRCSAFIHYLELIGNDAESKNLKEYELSKQLLIDFNQEVTALHSKMLLLGIYQNEGTSAMLHDLQNEITGLDIAVNTEKPELRILPSDGHPNAKGHALMADRVLQYLEKNHGF